MPTPREQVRPRTPHTAVKRELLVRYLETWAPTALHGAHQITYAEGYAGAGIPDCGEDGSPVAALRVFGELADRLTGHQLAVVLVEQDAERLRRLTGWVAHARAELGSPTWLTVHLVEGTAAARLIPALTDCGALAGPILAYLDASDPSSAAAPPFAVLSAIASGRSRELMVVLDPAVFALSDPDGPSAEAGDRLFGGRHWRGVSDQPDEVRYAYLVTSYRESLRAAGLGQIVHVELVDDTGAAQLLLFATTSAKNLDKLKDALWAVDEYAGVRYRDPRDNEHALLDIALQPHLGPLRRALLERVAEGGECTVADLRRHTLTETVYRVPDTTRVLGALLSAGSLTRSPERGRLAPDTLIRPAHP